MSHTKQAIIDAFWELLDEKMYNKITVRDIAERCGVNRNTFYYYFQDIPELATASIELWVRGIAPADGSGSLASSIRPMVEELTRRKQAFLHLYKSAQRDSFFLHLSGLEYRLIESYVRKAAAQLALPAHSLESLTRLYKCCATGIILDWLEADGKYDLMAFFSDVSRFFSGASERAFLMDAGKAE